MKDQHYVLDARTVNPHFPGIGRYVKNLVHELPDLLQPNERLSLITNEKIAVGLPQIIARSSPFSLQQQLEIPRLVHDSNASVYHSAYYLMPYFVKTPTIVTIYDFIPLLFPETVSWRARYLFQITTQFALRSAEHVLCISQATKRDLIRLYPTVQIPTSVTPLAPAKQFIVDADYDLSLLREKYDLPKQFSLYLGINKPHKNLARLFEAYAKLPNELRASFPLVIAGAWDERYKRLKETEGVRFLGRVPDHDLPALYTASSLFVFPSLYEGFGLPVIEAMACGAPVACANTSSLPEVAGDAALLFDPLSVDAIRDALQTLLLDAAKRKRMRQQSILQAQKFSWRDMAEKTLTVYRQMKQ